MRACCDEDNKITTSQVVERKRSAKKAQGFMNSASILTILVLIATLQLHPTLALLSNPACQTVRCSNVSARRKAIAFMSRVDDETPAENCERTHFHANFASLSRRDAIAMSLAAAASLIPSARASELPLEGLELGRGQWETLKTAQNTARTSGECTIPAAFATYATRFLIRYDISVSNWWEDTSNSYSLLPVDQRNAKLGRSFGSLAASIQIGIEQFLRDKQCVSTEQRQQGYIRLAENFLDKYKQSDTAKRHIGILFTLLPPEEQPTKILSKLATAKSQTVKDDVVSNAAPAILTQDLAALLPAKYHCAPSNNNAFAIEPAINIYAVGIDEEFGQSAVATPFGPLSSKPLVRENPAYSLGTYALFGLSGATGCALTHSVVIPLDVVKTKAQTDPGKSKSLLDGAMRIVKEEGPVGLLTGAQATMVAYFFYGLSVYPSYTYFKRTLSLTVLSPEIAMAHVNDIALVAGALAAVIASLGLTPLEAARIRVVADPDQYRPLGLTGTLGAIASEGENGLQSLYAGLPSLLTRQVIFGSVKFLAFERACEAIFTAYPSLRDATWTALSVSLVAGGISGAISSIVSQPADSYLTYIAASSSASGERIGLVEGCKLMIEEEGVGSLFRGLGSRCVWAAAIIAGQFLLYDVFRTWFGVAPVDLSQVFEISIPK